MQVKRYIFLWSNDFIVWKRNVLKIWGSQMIKKNVSVQLSRRICFLKTSSTVAEASSVMHYIFLHECAHMLQTYFSWSYDSLPSERGGSICQQNAAFFKTKENHMIKIFLQVQTLGKTCFNNAPTHMEYTVECCLMMDNENSYTRTNEILLWSKATILLITIINTKIRPNAVSTRLEVSLKVFCYNTTSEHLYTAR